MKKVVLIILCFSIGAISVYAQQSGKVSSSNNEQRIPDGGINDPDDPFEEIPNPCNSVLWYQDSDSDGYGNAQVSICNAFQPQGYVSDNTDCDDTNANVTGAITYYLDNDNDGIGGIAKLLCNTPSGNYVITGGDCDDNDPNIGIATILLYEDNDHDGYGDPNAPHMICANEITNYVANNLDECPQYYGTEANGCPIGGVPEDMNWIISRTYDVQGGLISSSKGYFDEMGRSIQSQSVDIKTGSTWAAQTLYDAKGRPALQSLSAPTPVAVGSFLYNTDFIKKNDGNTYTSADFETDENNPEPIGNQSGSLGWYYNESNTNEPYQDVTDYPFSRTVYSKLNPGSVLKTVGGNKISISGQQPKWLNGFTYSMPAAQELYYAFGKGYFGAEGVIEDSEEVITKFYKTISVDVHGLESVVFTDGEGKTLAAARVGGDTKYDVVSTIGEQGYVDIHIPNGISGYDIQFLGDINDYRVLNLRTDEPVYPGFVTGGNFYRVEYLGIIENSQSFINADGTITTPPNTKGIRYKVNYYDYSLNYYDKTGRLIETTQPLGFDENSLDLTLETPNHQMKSTFTYNAQNQLLETTSPDEGTANFIYREDGQIRLSQNSQQAIDGEFSYTNYDDLARPVESGVYNGTLAFGDTAFKGVTLTNVEGIKQEGSVISKVPLNSWNSGLATVKVISGDGYIQWQFPNANTSAMVGLSTTNANYTYSTIQYGLKVLDGLVYVYESNVQKAALGPYNPEDIFKIERVGNTISYKNNGVAYGYTSNNSLDLLADFAFFSSNSKVVDFEMGGNIILPGNVNPYRYYTNVSISGNTITKTGGTDVSWDAGVQTAQTISEDGAMSWTVNQNNKLIMMGLSSDTAIANPAFAFIDYAVYMHSSGSFYVYESGNQKGYFGTYATNDTFKIERTGSQIKYLKNGIVFYTSQEPSFNQDLMGFTSFRNLNASVSNINLTNGDYVFKDLLRVKTTANEITKTAGYSFDSGFASQESIAGDGFMSFRASTTDHRLMVGLSENSLNSHYNTIDFAIYLSFQRVYVYESGSYKDFFGGYAVGDTFKVERTGSGTIKYYKNNNVIYTSTETTTAPLIIDASFYNPEDVIADLELYDIVNASNVVDVNTSFDPQDCKERHITVYDEPDLTGLYASIIAEGIDTSHYRNQNFVAGNVSKTYTVNPSTTTTWYSYDIYGRVEWLVQKIDGLGTKTIDYEYDPLQGNVTKVLYQKHKPLETFVHQYYYNTTGELVSVKTSTDNLNFAEQANYTYYETGALKRTYLPQVNQGTDYVYNLAGQLKGINHPSLSSTKDPGGDANDAFGMHIDYYNGDYTRTGTPTPIETTPNGINRYDGNIKAVRWGTKGLDPNADAQHNAYTYTYDNNKWLKEAKYGTATNGLITLNPDNDYRVSNLTYDANGNLLSLSRNKDTPFAGENIMDNFTYNYNGLTNQLNYIDDTVVASATSDDLNSQDPNNYNYDSIGQLVKENQEGNNIEYVYNASGLVSQIKKDNEPYLNIYYNDKGHRVRKEVTYDNGGTWQETYYVRDASGSVMSIYTGSYGNQAESLRPKEYPVYGASRLGVYNKVSNITNYQLTDHLGNVRAVVSSDNGNIGSYTDYYPGGMAMPGRNVVGDYRYDYQGQELDKETGKVAFQLRLYDPRINRWLTTDPKGEFSSPYLAMGNNWINRIDPDGGKTDDHIYLDGDGNVSKVVEMEGANKFFDKNGVELSFNDAANLDSHMTWGHFEAGDNIYTPIHNLSEIVVNAGTIRPNVTASNKESYDFIQLALKSYGSWDFPYVLQNMFDVSNEEMNKAGYYGGSRTYFRFGKHDTVYNVYDAGQFVWGRAVGHSGFSLKDGLWGAGLNEKIFSGGSQGDTAADTQAITNGFHFQYHNQKVRGWD